MKSLGWNIFSYHISQEEFSEDNEAHQAATKDE